MAGRTVNREGGKKEKVGTESRNNTRVVTMQPRPSSKSLYPFQTGQTPLGVLLPRRPTFVLKEKR